MQIGLAYFNLDNLDEAMTNLDKAIQIDPTHAQCYLLRGNVYFKKGDTSEAIADFIVAMFSESC